MGEARHAKYERFSHIPACDAPAAHDGFSREVLDVARQHSNVRVAAISKQVYKRILNRLRLERI